MLLSHLVGQPACQRFRPAASGPHVSGDPVAVVAVSPGTEQNSPARRTAGPGAGAGGGAGGAVGGSVTGGGDFGPNKCPTHVVGSTTRRGSSARSGQVVLRWVRRDEKGEQDRRLQALEVEVAHLGPFWA